jgi:hypothetical protein
MGAQDAPRLGVGILPGTKLKPYVTHPDRGSGDQEDDL